MSETETEGMYTDLGDIVDPGVSPEDDGTGQSDPSDVVDPDVWSDEDGAGADGGLLGDLDLGDIADQLLDTDGSTDLGEGDGDYLQGADADQNPEAIDQML